MLLNRTEAPPESRRATEESREAVGEEDEGEADANKLLKLQSERRVRIVQEVEKKEEREEYLVRFLPLEQISQSQERERKV